MALGNVLTSGTYSTANFHYYNKTLKRCTIFVSVFTDNTKTNLMTEIPVYVDDTTVFDNNFSIAQIGGADKDILKAAYTYLKTLPIFASATDV